jgi:electron transfer flavoprotein alpha subunit
MNIKVLKDKCTGCKLCVKACPFGAIVVKHKLAVIDLTKCTLCGMHALRRLCRGL